MRLRTATPLGKLIIQCCHIPWLGFGRKKNVKKGEKKIDKKIGDSHVKLIAQ